jgi:hypothetical protein
MTHPDKVKSEKKASQMKKIFINDKPKWDGIVPKV